MNKYIIFLLFGVIGLSYERGISRKAAVPYRNAPSRLIYGGKESQAHSWPWMGWYTNELGTTVHCGCVLLHQNWIMTAAHCLYSFNETTVTFGDHDTTVDEGTEITRRIIAESQIIISDNYRPEYMNYDYDIALFDISSDPIAETDEIQYAELTTALPEAGGTATLTGWGKEEMYSGVSTVLREVVMPIVEEVVCDEFFTPDNDNEQFFICLQEEDKSACTHDSGGALNYREQGKWKVGGVGSYKSSGACDSGSWFETPPVAYTSTNKLACWIETNTGGAVQAYAIEGIENC